jgi:hypothetical protein
MANKARTGLKNDSTKNFIFGAGVLYKNFYWGTHYKQTFDKKPQENKTYYQISGGTGGISYTEFTGDEFVPTTAYYEKYEGYGGDKIGATKDGTKVTLTPEYTDIEVDGVLVKMEGLTQKTGEKGTIEAIVIDLDIDNIRIAVNGVANYIGSDLGSTDQNVTTKSWINEGDYISNLALVANKIGSDEKVIVWFKKALCTSGIDLDMKNKSVTGNKYVFEAYAEQSDENVDTLPFELIPMKKISV